MSATATTLATVDKVLGKACARNIPLELHHQDKHTKRLIVGRTRFLHLNENTILAETPRYRESDGRIPAGETVTAYLMLNGKPYAFKTAIEATGVRARLNERTRVLGITLRRPTSISELQRRANYRISLAGCDPVDVQLTRPHPTIPDASPVKKWAVTGRIVNISARGIALLVDCRHLRRAKPGEKFYLTFTLPEIEEEFVMLAVARHTSIVSHSDMLRIGLAFADWAGRNFEQTQQEITRFIADLERRMLRRKR